MPDKKIEVGEEEVVETQPDPQPQEPLHPTEQGVIDAEVALDAAESAAVAARRARIEHLDGKSVRVYALDGLELAVCDPDEVKVAFNTNSLNLSDVSAEKVDEAVRYLHGFVKTGNDLIADLLEKGVK